MKKKIVIILLLVWLGANIVQLKPEIETIGERFQDNKGLSFEQQKKKIDQTWKRDRNYIAIQRYMKSLDN